MGVHAFPLGRGAYVCDHGWCVVTEDVCHRPVPTELGVTLPTADGPGAPAPAGTRERHIPTSPDTWRLESGATSEPHQHQARPCLRQGEPSPGSISGLRPPSSRWGATCGLHQAPTAASTGKQGSRPAPLASYCVDIAVEYTRCPQLDLAAWSGARPLNFPLVPMPLRGPGLLPWKPSANLSLPSPGLHPSLLNPKIRDHKITAFQPHVHLLYHLGRPRPREGMCPVQDHTATKYQS